MKCLSVALLAAAAACAAALQARHLDAASATPASVQAAFRADGYHIVNKYSTGASWGVVAESNNVTLFTTGAPKKVYFVTGSAQGMGHVFGALSANDTLSMTTQYVDNVIPSMLDPTIIQKLGNDTIVQWLLEWIGDGITHKAVDSFHQHAEAGVFPAWITEEMAGIAAGANEVLPPGGPQVDPNRVIALSYGFDWLSSQVFSGAILHSVLADAEAALPAAAVARLRATLVPGSIRVPAYCDAFMVGPSGTKSGHGAFMGRDFQLATGGVLQDLATAVIYVPSDTALAPLVSVTAPGFVGSLTSLNVHGFAIGVDTLRAGFVNASRPGMNSVLLVRHTAHMAATTAAAVDVVRATERGVPFFYPMQDATGAGLVLEAGPRVPGTTVPDMRALVKDKALLAALPQWDALMAAAPVDYADGVFVRDTTYRAPASVPAQYNPGLWALNTLPYNASATTWGVLGELWPDFADENSHWFDVFSRYFSPARLPASLKDVVLVSNLALTPQMRVAEMTTWASVIPGEAMQWRFDTLARRVTAVASAGGFDLAVAQDTILFLDPWQAPGYWKVQAQPGVLGSTIIQGAIAVMDCEHAVLLSKTGYFGDGWLQISLPAYVK